MDVIGVAQQVLDALNSLLGTAQLLMTSPWFYAVLLAFALVDAVIPMVPSETVIVAAGVLAVTGTPNMVLVVAAATAGSFLGDHAVYLLGRLAGPRLLRSAAPGSRRLRSVRAAGRALAERGGIAIIAGRHIPGGRTAIMLTCGLTHYHRPRFALFSLVACVVWALMNAVIGIVGGIVFTEDPALGLLAGGAVALALGVGGEMLGRSRRRRRARREQLDADHGDAAAA